ncbi:MAG TPA: cation diffusion facilitator family transporter [Blastocatellia bacterium]|nr:cation diffusion facilitator family transporter [Blastocatellia bacterium]
MPEEDDINNADKHRHGHRHDGHSHSHTHGAVDPSILTTERGIRTVKWSFAGLFATALLQAIVVWFSGSVALLADTLHNLGDAFTAVPLWVAFRLARREPTKRFTYGYGRVEDLAGVAIVLTILLSAIAAGYESVDRLLNPQKVEFLWAVIAASVIGFLGNEAVALFRIKVGKEIGSAALVADGYHARADGLTSLAVLFGALGVWLGFPPADPLVGILITIGILRIVWQSGKTVFSRLLDGVDPEVVDEIRHAISHVPGVKEVNDIRVRWLGHRLHAELSIAVGVELSVEQGHELAREARHQLLHRLRYLSNATIHVDPVTAPGESHHYIAGHTHDGLPRHSH